jgi:hypothetical protein
MKEGENQSFKRWQGRWPIKIGNAPMLLGN